MSSNQDFSPSYCANTNLQMSDLREINMHVNLR